MMVQAFSLVAQAPRPGNAQRRPAGWPLVVAVALSAAAALPSTAAAEASSAAPAGSVELICTQTVSTLRATIAQAPLNRQERLTALLDQQQVACDGLAATRAERPEVEVAVAEAQIELSLARVKAAVGESEGSRAALLGAAVQAVKEALESSSNKPARTARMVRVTLQADGPGSDPAHRTSGLEVMALPQSVFFGAALLPPNRLRDLLVRLRFPNNVKPTQPSERALPAGGGYLVWIAVPQPLAELADQLRDSSRRERMTFRMVAPDAASPVDLRFAPADAVALPSSAPPPVGSTPATGNRPEGN